LRVFFAAIVAATMGILLLQFMNSILAFTLAGCICLSAGAVQAQDMSLPPTNGTYFVSQTFGHTTIEVTAGGTVSAPQNCGYISQARHFRVRFENDRQLVVAVRSTEDTTLLINHPNGVYTCEDDSGGTLNPIFISNQLAVGVYDFWVGTYAGGTATAYVQISQE
jgi:hypothetical protein